MPINFTDMINGEDRQTIKDLAHEQILADEAQIKAFAGEQAVNLTEAQAITGEKNFIVPPKINSSVIYNEANIVGIVSQTGGVPTGAIIERGSNANGEYVKYADGTLICFTSKSTGGINTQKGGYSILGMVDWLFPSTFIGIPYISYGRRSEFAYEFTSGFGALSISSATQWAVKNISTFSQVTASHTFCITAIGRWY